MLTGVGNDICPISGNSRKITELHTRFDRHAPAVDCVPRTILNIILTVVNNNNA